MQIEPLERAIKQKKIRVLELEVSLEKLLHQREYRGITIFLLTIKQL